MKLLSNRPSMSICVAVLMLGFTAPRVHAAVVISEVYPAPPTGEPEWVELFNTGSEPVSLAGWFLKDQLSTPSVIFTFSTQVIGAQQFVVAELPSAKLNNSGDGVNLFTADSQQQDVMSFSSSEASKSWQRTSPTTITYILTTATKGSDNLQYSLYPANPQPTPTAQPTATPTPASPEPATPTPAAAFNQSTEEASPSPSPSPTPTPSATPLPMTSPTLLLTPTPSPSPTPLSTPTPSPTPAATPNYAALQLSEIEPCPSSGNEWIELANTSDGDIEIKNWKITDESGNTKNMTGTVLQHNWQVFSWSGSFLNNTGDSFTITTETGQTFAHGEYDSCTSGYSLVLGTQDDSTIWLSTEPTPGAKNSDPLDLSLDETTAGLENVNTISTSASKKSTSATPKTNATLKNPLTSTSTTFPGLILGVSLESLAKTLAFPQVLAQADLGDSPSSTPSSSPESPTTTSPPAVPILIGSTLGSLLTIIGAAKKAAGGKLYGLSSPH